MTIAADTPREDYIGTGDTDTYSYTFLIRNQSELEVIETVIATGVETVLTVSTQYTVSGVGSSSGGSITLVAGDLPSTKTLTILLKKDISQGLDIKNQRAYQPHVYEKALDDQARISQLLQEQITRSVKIPKGMKASDFDPTLPGILVADSVLAVNGDGDGLAMGPTIAAISGAAASASAAASSAADALAAQIAAEAAEAAAEGLLADITAEGAAQIAAVEAEGTSQIALIAADVQSAEDAATAAQAAQAAAEAAEAAAEAAAAAAVAATQAEVDAVEDALAQEILDRQAGDAALQLAMDNLETLPAGGTTGQLLTKQSITEGDAAWQDPPVALPSGGTAGQILQKSSATEGDAAWVDLPPSSVVTTALQTVTDGLTITANASDGFQLLKVRGNLSGVLTASTATAPFGSLAFLDGQKFMLVGHDDDQPLTIPYSDTSKGCLLNGAVTLFKGNAITLIFDSTLDRFVEVSRNA